MRNPEDQHKHIQDKMTLLYVLPHSSPKGKMSPLRGRELCEKSKRSHIPDNLKGRLPCLATEIALPRTGILLTLCTVAWRPNFRPSSEENEGKIPIIGGSSLAATKRHMWKEMCMK